MAAGVASWPAESIVRYDLCKSALSGLVTRKLEKKVVAWAEARAVAARFPYWIKSADKPTTYGIIRAMAQPSLPGKILAEKATAKVDTEAITEVIADGVCLGFRRKTRQPRGGGAKRERIRCCTSR